MTGVTRDGKTASSTNVTTMVSKDRMTWQSRDRIVGDEVHARHRGNPHRSQTAATEVTVRVN